MRLCFTVAVVVALHTSLAGAQHSTTRPLTPAEVALYARVLAMADARVLDSALVDRAFASASPGVRAAAALAVGQVGPTAGAPRIARLRSLSMDRDSLVAGHALYAIGLLRDSASSGDLARALGRPDVGADAAWALGQVGEPARAAIVGGLQALATVRSTRVQLLLASTKLRPLPLAAIIPHLASPDPSTVWAAAYAIARPRAPGGVRALIQLASSGIARDGSVAQSNEPHFWYELGALAAARIRAEVARGLTAAVAGDSLGDTAFAILGQLALDPAPHVRINALRSLATYDSRSTPLLIAATGDADRNVRLAAVQSLAVARAVGDVNWQGLWQVDTTLAYRGSVLEAALVHGGTLPAATLWATNASWQYRAGGSRRGAGGPAARPPPPRPLNYSGQLRCLSRAIPTRAFAPPLSAHSPARRIASRIPCGRSRLRLWRILL